MNVSSLGNLSSIFASSAVSSASTTSSTAGVSAACGEGVSSEISGPGKWMRELEELRQSDPEKFQEVTAAIADRLEEAAGEASGDEATFLSELGDKFSQASQDGDLSALMPPGGAPPPPPPPSGDGGDTSSTAGDGSASSGSSAQVQKYSAQQRAGAAADDLVSTIDELILSVLRQQGVGSASSSGDSVAARADGIIESQLSSIGS